MSKFLEIMEIELHQIATIIKLFIEGAAVAIITFSIFKTISKFIKSYKRKNSEEFYHEIRLYLGLSLALALEFLLAADIVGTAVTPTWEAIARLGAIAAIRTFLNYFLHQEVKELETERQNSKING